MKIPNPFGMLFRVICWPFFQGFMLLLHSVRFQKWWLRSFAKMGTPENSFNRTHGIQATYAIAEPHPVEGATSDEEKTSGEAKP